MGERDWRSTPYSTGNQTARSENGAQMIRAGLLTISIIILIAITDVVLALVLDLQFSSKTYWGPLAYLLILVCIYACCRRFPEPRFLGCLAALLQLLAFVPAYVVLMRAVTTFHRPLIDHHLVEFDHLLGIHIPEVMAWFNRHPALDWLLNSAYGTLFHQTLFVLIFLGFRNARRPLSLFVLRFMISLLPTTLIHALFPAEGPFTAYHYDPTASQKHYLEDFRSLRSGRSREIGWHVGTGLITFPSFHTTWAMLLVLALRRHRLLFAASTLLNGLVILSTMTSGWHYFTDVLAGMAVCILTIVLIRRLDAWLFPREIVGSAPGL